MRAAKATDALLIVFAALSEDQREEALSRMSQAHTETIATERYETQTERMLRSLQRVAAEVGYAPSVDEYKDVSAELIAAGEDVVTFSRLYKHFGSWPRAREALGRSSNESARLIEARSQAPGRKVLAVQGRGATRHPRRVRERVRAGADGAGVRVVAPASARPCGRPGRRHVAPTKHKTPWGSLRATDSSRLAQVPDLSQNGRASCRAQASCPHANPRPKPRRTTTRRRTTHGR